MELYASWISSVPPGATLAPHVTMSSRAGRRGGRRRCRAGRGFPARPPARRGRSRRTWRTRSATPAAARLARKASWSDWPSSAVPWISCGSAVVAGVGIDGGDGHALGRRRGQHHGRLPAVAADLRDGPTRRHRGSGVPELLALCRGHPALDGGSGVERGGPVVHEGQTLAATTVRAREGRRHDRARSACRRRAAPGKRRPPATPASGRPRPNHDPFLPLALAAEHTDRVELGTSIAVAFARNPMLLANTAWDLQAYSGGRFILGLGSQIKPHITKRFSMPWSHPAPRMREMVLAIRAIWDCWLNGTKLELPGRLLHAHADDAVLHPRRPATSAGIRRPGSSWPASAS